MKKEKEKIILFRGKPNKGKIFSTPLPLGLLAIASPLDKEGYDIIILDSTVDYDYIEKIIKNAKESICVGISSMTGYQIHEGLLVAKTVKKICPNVPIIWGGFHPSILPEQTIKHPLVDIVVVGQGERTFQELVHNLQEEKPLDNVKGILYKKDGKIIKNNPRPFESLDNFPSYAFHLVDMEKYIFKSEFATRTSSYVSSYGCAHNCIFCAEQKMFKRRWLGKSPERVVKDLEALSKKYNVDGVYIGDSNFFQSPERVKNICKLIISKELNIKWYNANGRIETLAKFDNEFWRLLSESGCRSILVGAESGSQEVLDFIGKNTDVKESLVVAKRTKEFGIKVFWSFMLGFPHTDDFKVPIEEEFDKTLDLIIAINRINNNHKIMWFLLTPYPETPIYGLCKTNGFKGHDDLDGWANHDFNREPVPWIPHKYVNILNQLNVYVFPYSSKWYIYATLSKISNIKTINQFAPIFKIFAILLHKTSTFRLNHKFFSLPLEYILIKKFSRHFLEIQADEKPSRKKEVKK